MSIFNKISEIGVVPVIAIDDADKAIALADALLEGGLPLAEITFRTDAAAQAIENISVHRPEMLVGAGTVLSIEQLDECKHSGAKFALSPGLDPEILTHAKDLGIPFAPGIMTPSEILIAIRAGCEMMKFFPAGAAGGPNMLKNISAPVSHLNISFNPTGGVNLKNMDEWLTIPSVKAVGGTWIATREDINTSNFAKITANAKAAVSRVKEIRGV